MDQQRHPHDEQAEQSVLGVALAFPDALDGQAVSCLTGEHFFRSAHRQIWSAIAALTAQRSPVDAISVHSYLNERGQADGVGGLQYLGALAQSVPSARNLQRYVEIVKDRALRRSLIETADAAQEIALEPGDALEKLERAISLFTALQRASGVAREPVSIGDALLQRSAYWEALEAGTVAAGMRTHLPTLDGALGGGLKGGFVLTLAARPSVGKTSLALQILLNVAADGNAVLLFSQEMLVADLADRTASNLGRVSLSNVVTGKFSDGDWGRLSEAAERGGRLPLYIDDRPALTLLELRATARHMKQARGIRVVAVDYLQLCASAGGKESRHHQIEAISRGLKQLAKELDVCVLVLSQINRQATNRADGEPTLSDLKESGAIEEDADTVLLLHPKGNLPDGSLLVAAILAKNRQGRRGRIALAFHGATQRWVESTADVSAKGSHAS